MKALILLVAAMLLVAGCTQGPQASADVMEKDDKMEEKPKDDQVMAPKPSFSIASPGANGMVMAGDVVVTLDAQNFEIGKPETANREGEGHFHLYLDDGEYIACASTTCTVPGVTEGEHVIKVTMHQNDHSLYEGVEPQMVAITAKGAPGFEIMSPKADETVARGNVVVKLQLKNFKIGQPETANKDREGHFHLYLDNGDYIPCASETCTVSSVGPGQHTVKVDMRNNDHSLYGDGSEKTVTFTVR